MPPDLQSRRVEIVFLALEESNAADLASNADWPAGLFERTAGAWQGELLREHQGDYEQRRELD